MKRPKIKALSSTAQLVANLRAPIHRPTQGHKSATAYNRRDKGWRNQD